MATLKDQLDEVEASTDDKKVYSAIAAVGFAAIAVLTALKLFFGNEVIPTPLLVCIMVLLGIPTLAIGGVRPVQELLNKHGLKRQTATHVHALKKLEAQHKHELEKLKAEQAHELKLAETKALTEAGFEPANLIDGVQLYKQK